MIRLLALNFFYFHYSRHIRRLLTLEFMLLDFYGIHWLRLWHFHGESDWIRVIKTNFCGTEPVRTVKTCSKKFFVPCDESMRADTKQYRCTQNKGIRVTALSSCVGEVADGWMLVKYLCFLWSFALLLIEKPGKSRKTLQKQPRHRISVRTSDIPLARSELKIKSGLSREFLLSSWKIHY